MDTVISRRSNRSLRSRLRLALPFFVAMIALAACTSGGGGDNNRGNESNSSTSPSSSPSPEPPTITVTPANQAVNVAPAAPVTVKVDRGKITAVSVKSTAGDVMDGTVSADGASWAGKGKLAFGSTYTITATLDSGDAAQTVSTFTTAPQPSDGQTVRTVSALGDNVTYGVGMPIILQLSQPLESAAQRAAFENALTVKSTPATTGAWGWVNNKEVHFRPTQYWTANSTVHVTVDTAGRELGNGLWGRSDLTVDFKIGIKRELVADATTHRALIYENGTLVKNFPASLGSQRFPSSSGTMVIMDKQRNAIFDSSTYGVPVNSPDGYRTPVEYAMRITWGGEFYHAAPWSVEQQGRENVSHGCVNLATQNAAWLYNRTITGDIAVVKNTGVPLEFGNGWTDWNVSFDAWLKYSATGQKSTA